MISEHDPVVLTTDLQDRGLPAHALGAVVAVPAGGEVFAVEFVTYDGRTVGVLTVTADQARPLGANEMPAARPLADARPA